MTDPEKETNLFSPQLFMTLDDLAGLPAVTLPEGYAVRSFHPGDERHWEEIVNDSFQKKSDYVQEMEKDGQYLPERVLFICHHGRPVATASAWHREEYGQECGYLHMVGILSAYAGKGLGMQISLAALHAMKQEGCSKAVLHTDDFRIPALKIYFKIGFVPNVVHDNQFKRWNDIAEALHIRIQL
ncbi:GNAT family N-acetyltransferase [Paenibacillus sp. GCM10027626]|uniref:GNAT family N-acetyltransferase n=1 Tax=Paenibacillus sp. GCM10027626 TaxID=3273411 RepID=UPI003644BC26